MACWRIRPARTPLTGLGNRLRMREDLEVLVARAKRYGQGYGVILFDVDCFKLYNDTQGHLAGDDVLKKVAGVLAETVRMGDTVYRYGGEEFLALLPEQSVEASRLVAERLRRGVERLGITHEARSNPSIITISAGVSSTLSSADAGDSITSDEVLKAADEELYKAKEAGRNLVFARGGDL